MFSVFVVVFVTVVCLCLLIYSYFSQQELGIPCFLGGMARGLLGRNSNFHIRQRRRDALKEADLVILAGEVIKTVFNCMGERCKYLIKTIRMSFVTKKIV